MIKPIDKIPIIIVLILSLFSCKQSAKQEEDVEKRQYVRQQNPVEILVLKQEVFHDELISNGKLKALVKSELKFSIGAEIESVEVKNGDVVKEGQLIARLKQFEYKQALEKSKMQLKKTDLELQNLIIGQGYKMSDSTDIPSNVWNMARVRSGYESALHDVETAKYNLLATKLRAPFNGKIANIKQKSFEQVNNGEAFCSLINDSEFEVEFSLVENEIGQVAILDAVQIIPFSVKKTFKGKITEINPMVDENGLVLVKALVRNNGELMEGMNVKVLIEKKIPDQLVVPKQAIVLRQNQEVLFKYTNGLAYWIYVQTLHENSSSCSVIAHPDKGGELSASDTIIISGNLNLAHESEVMIKQ